MTNLSKPVADSLQSYQSLLDQTFGSGMCTAKQDIDQIHNVLGALNNPAFQKFSDCFKNRLKRLESYYVAGSDGRQKIIYRLQDLSHPTGWSGPYSELLAIDFLNFHGIRKHFRNPVLLDNKLLAIDTWASSFPGRAEADLDVCFPELLNVYGDIKIFQDTANDFLTKLIADFRTKYPNTMVLAEKPAPLGKELDGKVRAKILAELESTAANQDTFVQSTEIPGLSFRLSWDQPSVLTSTTVVNPYEMAETRHISLFDYSTKFMKNSPFVLFLVKPAWKEHRISDFQGMNHRYYRALARRMFCQYEHSPKLHRELFSKIQTNESLAEVSRTVSAIVILEDQSPECADPSELNLNAFCFVNPNARNELSSLFHSYMREWGPELLEDFGHDNY